MGPNLGGETWGISGSTFLVVYLVIALAALVAVFGMRRSLRGTGFRADAAQLARSPEDVAYLNGGRDLAVYAALSAMHVDRSIGTAPGIKGMVRAGGPVPAHDIGIWIGGAGPRMMRLIGEHEAIIAAIDAKDGDGSARAMRSHLNGILADLPQIEADNPDLFE